jgi:hypothetical protein
VLHDQVAVFAYVGDGPAVTVLDPVVGREAEAAIVGAGDDHISDTGVVPVRQRHLGCHMGVIKMMRPGTAVEFGDQVPGGGEHDRVEPSRSIENPSVERILSGGVTASPTRTRP